MTLSCPTPQNAAAIAKQMHETAVEAEARIYDLEYRLRAAANRPTIIQTTNVLQTGIIDGFEDLIGPTFGGVFVTNFNNTAANSDDPVANNDELFTILGEGIYEVGLTGNLVPSGVVNAGSYRIVRVQQYTPDPSFIGGIQNGYRLINSFGYTLFESNVGAGVDFTLIGQLRIKPLDIIFFTVLHNNTSSTLNLSIGCIGWVHKLSDVTITEVL